MGESDIDRLFEEIARSRGRSAGPVTATRPLSPEPQPEPEPEPSRRGWLLGTLGALVAFCLIATALSLISRGASTISADGAAPTASVTTALAQPAATVTTEISGSVVATPGRTARPGAGTASVGGTATATATTARGSVTTAPGASTTGASTTVAPSGVGKPGEVTADNPSGTIRWIVVKDHILHLRGFAPTQAAADQTAAVVPWIWGAQPMVNEIVIDPSVPAIGPIAVYIRDLIEFDVGSTTLKPEYSYILDAGVRLLLFFANPKIRIIARSDDGGSPGANTGLASTRAQAVVTYAAGFGVTADRFLIDNRGDGGATLADVSLSTARNRSLEFQVVGTILA